MELLVATRNPGKMREFRFLLAALRASLVFPTERGLAPDVLEDGSTYLENATGKAIAYASASGMLALADDSGLEVDALGGAPGVRSARYAPGNDADRVSALLGQLSKLPKERRTARFRCVVVIASPAGDCSHAEGVCQGTITLEPTGAGGFGYDPIFYLPEHSCTMAQLPAEAKNRISHRARAIEALLPVLRRRLAAGT